MTELEQELQGENEQLAQQLVQAKNEILALRAKEQSAAELASIIRDQESEILSLKQKNANLTKQNEKLLVLAQSEKQLQEQNKKLQSENASLQQNLKNESKKSDSLQNQLEKAMTIRLPDEALLKRFTSALQGADDRARDIMVVHWINLAVVAIFVVLAGVSGYLSYSASKSAEKANTAVFDGIYDKDGWSMVPGAYLNEYTAFTERPEWYARYKTLYPEKTHY